MLRKLVHVTIGVLLLVAGAVALVLILQFENAPPQAGDDDGRIRIIRIIDGDTFDVAANGRTVRVRLFGADAPERGHRCYDVATSRLRELLMLGNDRVELESGPRATDSGGRTLAYAWVETSAGRQLVDEVLVQTGDAEAWRRDGQHRDRIIAAESAARQANQGCLWQ
jgi:endonuclease YncB( thermonuclease family)